MELCKLNSRSVYLLYYSDYNLYNRARYVYFITVIITYTTCARYLYIITVKNVYPIL